MATDELGIRLAAVIRAVGFHPSPSRRRQFFRARAQGRHALTAPLPPAPAVVPVPILSALAVYRATRDGRALLAEIVPFLNDWRRPQVAPTDQQVLDALAPLLRP